MHATADPSTEPLAEARWIESSLLKARLAIVGIGVSLFISLPWPYPRWIQAAAVAGWLLLGVVNAQIVRESTAVRTIRAAGRALLAYDTITTSLIVMLYVPLVSQAWAALVIFILIGAARERRAGAINMGAAVVAILVVMHRLVLPRMGLRTSLADLAAELAIVVFVILLTMLLVETVERTSTTLEVRSEELRKTAAREVELRVASEAHAATLRRVVELSVALLRERELGALLDRILEATLQTFGFGAGAVLVAERDREVFRCAAIRGYPPDLEANLRRRQLPFAAMDLRIDRRFEIRPSVYYAPVERQMWYTQPSHCLRPESLGEPRKGAGHWHVADLLAFTLRSSNGEVIGVSFLDAPVGNKLPTDDTLDATALFARLAAAAIENLHLVEAEQRRAAALSEQNVEIRRLHASAEETAEERRRQVERLARILEVSVAIFREADLDRLLRRILEVTLETFGFTGGTFIFRDPEHRVWVRRVALGYDALYEGQEIAEAEMKAAMSARTRVRDTFYYVPMELEVQGGVNRHPERANLPRGNPGDWHEEDMMLFPIFDSRGELIGALSPDDPKDGKKPSDPTVRTIEVFAQLAGIAVEFARLRGATAASRN